MFGVLASVPLYSAGLNRSRQLMILLRSISGVRSVLHLYAW